MRSDRTKEPGWTALAGAALIACTPLLACAPAQVAPVVTVALAAPPPGEGLPTPAERLLALLTDDNGRLERVAMSLASMGEGETTRAAGRRLVSMARAVGSEAWRAAERARIASEAGEGAAPPARIEDREAEAFARILAAMSHIGGPAVAAYCFALAEDEATPWDRRRLALRVLDRVVDRGDAAKVEQRARIAARLPPESAPQGPSVPEAIAQLRRAFMRCYKRALDQDPTFQARVRVTLHVGARGRTSSKVEGSALPADFERCLVDAANGVQAVHQGVPGGDITVPVMFVPQR